MLHRFSTISWRSELRWAFLHKVRTSFNKCCKVQWTWNRPWNVSRVLFVISRYMAFVAAGMTSYGEQLPMLSPGTWHWQVISCHCYTSERKCWCVLLMWLFYELKGIEYSAHPLARLQMVIEIPNSQRLVTDFYCSNSHHQHCSYWRFAPCL
jgi:hypothetical protein